MNMQIVFKVTEIDKVLQEGRRPKVSLREQSFKRQAGNSNMLMK